MIHVVLAGATGKMGREVVRALAGRRDMRLVGAVGRRHTGEDVGTVAGVGSLGVPIRPDLGDVLRDTRPHVLVDFTTPAQGPIHVRQAIEAKVHAVVGTTGFLSQDMAAIDEAAREAGVGVLIAPNFALGAVLMIRFAREAARYMPHVEIIEFHHDQKKDAPSGTAVLTAEVLEAVRAEAPGSPAHSRGSGVGSPGPASLLEETGTPVPARGARIGSVHVHSVRLPGLVAHQEVIFGAPGQVLTLRHDSLDRSSFMPGVLLGIEKVSQVRGLVYGLEALLFPPEDRPLS